MDTDEIEQQVANPVDRLRETVVEQQAVERVVEQVERRTGKTVPAFVLDRSAQARASLPHGVVAATKRGTVVLPQAAGSLTGARARSLLAHELTHVQQQSRHFSAVPGTVDRQEYEAQSVAAAVAGPHGPGADLASRSAMARYATAPTAPAQVTANPAPAAAPAVAAATVTSAPAPAAPAPVAPAAMAAPAPSPAVASRPQAQHASTSAPAFDASALDRRQLDLLANRLYARLRSQLRDELLTDRDRRSRLAEIWT